MEFWGIEVKPGSPFKVIFGRDQILHVSQASLGESKSKKEEFVSLHVKVRDQKLVIGNLSTENIPQILCDLVFQKDFELSHNWTEGSVYFVGYKSPSGEDDEDFSDTDSEEEEKVVEEVPATITANGNAKPKAKPAQVTKNGKPAGGTDVDDDEDSEEEEETPTPKKAVSNKKKRANEEAPKTPVSSKKAKKDEKKKGGSPKSASQVACGSCKKTFNSGNALESHTKAKHAAAK